MDSTKIAPAWALVFFALASSGCATGPKQALDPAERTLAGGREAIVSVVQGEIRADIDPSMIGGPGAALLGPALAAAAVLVNSSINQSKASIAETVIKPLRDSLGDYDFDRRASQGTKDLFGRLPWLGVQKISFTKERTKAKMLGALDQSAAPEVIFVDYDYALSADFSKLRVSSYVLIAPKKLKASGKDIPEFRIKPDSAAYVQRFTCIFPLTQPPDEDIMDISIQIRDNAPRWVANGGKLARWSLDQGLNRLLTEMERSLAQSPDATPKDGKGEEVTAGGDSGTLIERTDQGVLFMNALGTWVFVATALN